MNGMLYIVSTPIGNLDDMTFRAIKILKEVDYILCEDTRTSQKLLNHFAISKKVVSYHNFNEKERVNKIIEDLKNGLNIAQISDAGTPIISDPGYVIAKACIENNITITNVVGANAIIPSVVLSGFDCSKFIYWGFLSSNKTQKEKELNTIILQQFPVVFYETPHRIYETLKIINEISPNSLISISKELTKIHEKILRGKACDLMNLEDIKKGEMVVVIQPEKKEINFNNLSIKEHFEYYLSQGLEKKEIIKKIAKDRKVEKNIIFKMFSND